MRRCDCNLSLRDHFSNNISNWTASNCFFKTAKSSGFHVKYHGMHVLFSAFQSVSSIRQFAVHDTITSHFILRD